LITKFERDRDTARDLTQECFSHAWRGWQGFRQDASVRTWLSHIAINVLRSHARRQARRAAERDPVCLNDDHARTQSSPETLLLVKEKVQAIWSASSFVSMQQSTAFRLRFAHDLTMVEIAGVMGISEGAVKGHLFRAVQTIRRVIRGKNQRIKGRGARRPRSLLNEFPYGCVD
jgi:RNA polymerase sigma-70 factor (ECF subfamily)